MDNKTFEKVSEMLKDNKYAVCIDEGYFPDYIQIYPPIDGRLYLEITQCDDNEYVHISGIGADGECSEDVFCYDENKSWKDNVLAFYLICAKVFGKAAEEYMLYDILEWDEVSLTIN